MAFTVEDGTGLAAATSYIDEAFADAYFVDRGNTAWAALSSANKEIALIKATDYIDNRFGRRFVGIKLTKAQALEWPRDDAYDRDGYALDDTDLVPRQLQKATAEYALRAATILDLLPDPQLQFTDRDTTGRGSTQSSGQAVGEVKGEKVKVGEIEISTNYSTLSESAENNGDARITGTSDVPGLLIPAYPAADLLLTELLKSNSSVERS